MYVKNEGKMWMLLMSVMWDFMLSPSDLILCEICKLKMIIICAA